MHINRDKDGEGRKDRQTDWSHISAGLDRAKMAADWLPVCHEVRHTLTHTDTACGSDA